MPRWGRDLAPPITLAHRTRLVAIASELVTGAQPADRKTAQRPAIAPPKRRRRGLHLFLDGKAVQPGCTLIAADGQDPAAPLVLSAGKLQQDCAHHQCHETLGMPKERPDRARAEILIGAEG